MFPVKNSMYLEWDLNPCTCETGVQHSIKLHCHPRYIHTNNLVMLVEPHTYFEEDFHEVFLIIILKKNL